MRPINFQQWIVSAFQSLGQPTRRRPTRISPRLESLETRVLLAVQMVSDLKPTGGSSPSSLTVVGNTLFFTADNGSDGVELWKSDGTSAGTVMVKNINTNTGTGSGASNLTNVNGTLFFSASSGIDGTELWKSDGTSSGTVMVKDINFSIGMSGNPANLTNVNGTLFFTADNGTNGVELWKSDGTTSNTTQVLDIWTSGSSSPSFLTNVGGTLFFTATNGSGTELWKSDGTTGGTTNVKDIRSGANSSSPANLTNVNGVLLFSATDGGSTGQHGMELWRSDGTSTGTTLVYDIRPDTANSNPDHFVNVSGKLFFEANDGTTGFELWTSDGTSAGTNRVKDINNSTSNSNPSYLTNVNGVLFFAAVDGVNGAELWRSGGTEANTVMVKDINPVAGSSPQFLTNVNGTLFFAASDGTSTAGHGVELWKSDGTSSGTILVYDINSGSGASAPKNLVNLNGRLFFNANNPSVGEELWTAYNSPPTAIALSPAAVNENLPSGTTVGTLSSTDVDAGNTFTYTLVSGAGDADNGSFTLDGNTVTTSASFDRETKSSYTVRVRTTDQGGLFYETDLAISINNVNENPSNISLSTSSVDENLPSGTTVGTFSTTDVDVGDTYTYTLVSGTGDADNGSFTIDGNALKTAASFNFETKSSYTVRVRTTDQGGLFTEQDFPISVNNVNDAPSQISLSSPVNFVLANASTTNAIRLGDVSIVDDDLGTNSTSLSGPDASVFELVSNQLRLKAGTVFNYAAKKTYSVTLNVDDTSVGGTPDASYNFTLSLQGFDGTTVQNGSAGRSYVRYVALNFAGALGLSDAVASLGTSAPRVRLTFSGTTGTQSIARSLTTGMVSTVGNSLRIDFGVNGVGGNANSSAGDGTYRLRVDLDGDGTAEISATFFRLFGDADGNGVVNDVDVALVTSAQGQTGLNLGTDLNGDGVVDGFDLSYVKSRKGAKVYYFLS